MLSSSHQRKVTVHVAANVAARGLGISKVDYFIHCERPNDNGEWELLFLHSSICRHAKMSFLPKGQALRGAYIDFSGHFPQVQRRCYKE